jgi:hypothetical protein
MIKQTDAQWFWGPPFKQYDFLMFIPKNKNIEKIDDDDESFYREN